MLSFLVVSLAVNDVFHELHGLRFIDIHKFPVAHNPFPVHHAEADVFAVGGVNESGIFVTTEPRGRLSWRRPTAVRCRR